MPLLVPLVRPFAPAAAASRASIFVIVSCDCFLGQVPLDLGDSPKRLLVFSRDFMFHGVLSPTCPARLGLPVCSFVSLTR